MEPTVHQPNSIPQPQNQTSPVPIATPQLFAQQTAEQIPTPVSPPPPQSIATPGDTYHSNPFSASLTQLSVLLKTNPVSTLTLGLFMILVIAVVAIITSLLSSIVPGLVAKSLLLLIGTLLYFIIFIRFYAASIYLHIASRRNQTITAQNAVKDVTKQNYTKFWLTTFAVAALILIGFILLIIPGVYILGKLMLAPFVAMNEGLSVGASLKRSWALSKGHWFEIVSASLAQAILLPNTLLSFVGGQSGTASRYFELSDLQKSGAQKPKTHWLNYVLPILFIVGVAGYFGLLALAASSSNKNTCTNSAGYYSTGTGCRSSNTDLYKYNTKPYNYNPTNNSYDSGLNR